MIYEDRRPLVSVLIPMYNSALYIADTLDSVLNQTYDYLEVIVVDDGSTDNSLEIVQSYEKNDKRLACYALNHQGACAARNFAFEKSKGIYIQYLDADDLLSSDKIEKQVLRLQEDSLLSLVTCTFRQFKGFAIYKEWDNLYYVNKNYDRGRDLLTDLWYYFVPSYIPSCYLTHRSLIEKAGKWDERLLKNQDGEFFSRILFTADKIGFVENVCVYWRLVENSISHSHSEAKAHSVYETYKKISILLLSNGRTPKTMSAVARAWGFYIYIDANYKLAKRALAFCKKMDVIPIYPNNRKVFVTCNRFLSPIIAKKIDNALNPLRQIINQRNGRY